MSSPWKKQPEDVVDSVLKRAEVSKVSAAGIHAETSFDRGAAAFYSRENCHSVVFSINKSGWIADRVCVCRLPAVFKTVSPLPSSKRNMDGKTWHLSRSNLELKKR